MTWLESHRADPEARAIADRHYNRQKIGTPQFVPPGRCLVLKTATAFWVTRWPFAEYTKHLWAGAWVCSAFRNEGLERSSDMIRAAIKRTKEKWPEPPSVESWVIIQRKPKVTLIERVKVCMVTFVNGDKVKHKRDLGRCYLRAGFEYAGETKGGLVALVLRTEKLKEACYA